MKGEELVIGKKYVPLKKSVGKPLEAEKGHWGRAVRENQGFLYYVGIGGGTRHCFSFKPDETNGIRLLGDWFLPEDVVEYPYNPQYKPDRAFLKEIWNISLDEQKKELESKYSELNLSE